MAQKVVSELTEQLRLTQKGRIAVFLDPEKTPEQIDKAKKALSLASLALTDAVIDDLHDGDPKVKALTEKIIKNNSKLESATEELKRTVEIIKLLSEVVKLSVDVIKIIP